MGKRVEKMKGEHPSTISTLLRRPWHQSRTSCCSGRLTIAWTQLESHFRDFAALKDTCLKDGTPYMLSMKMGKNMSWENFGKGMTHAFVLEFKDETDRDYYLLKDPVHHRFSKKAATLIEDSVVVDLKDGVLVNDLSHAQHAGARLMKGTCQCGNIRWEVKLDAYRHVICHCRSCQLLGGGPFSCNSVVPKDALRVKEGKLSVYSYTGASGKPVLCYHCSRCTSHVYHHAMSDPDNLIIRTLLLDGGDTMGVGGELFGEAVLGWVKDLKGALADI